MIASWRLTIGLVYLLAYFLLAGRPATAEPLAPEQTAAIDAAVMHQLTAQHVPGISIAIERDGQMLYAHGYGYRDVAAAKPVNADTYFEIGSITKQFTAAALSKLAGDGKVRFADRVSTYLPSAPHAPEITVQELLNHTSGLHEYLDQPGAAAMLHSTSATPADVYGLIATLPLDFAPGTQYAYSNSNYAVLGAIIERVSGMSYADFLRKRVLDGTPFSGISYGEPIAQTVAYGYEPGESTKPLSIFSPNVTYAAGALYAKPADLARWDDAFFGGRVVPQPMVILLTTPPNLAYAKKTTYAAGWVVDDIDGHKEIWHNGGLPGFTASNCYFPDQHMAIVITVNAMSPVPSLLTRDLFRLLVPLTADQIAAKLTAAPGEDPAITARMREQWTAVASGHIDRTQYDATSSARLTDPLVATAGAQITQLGVPTNFVFLERSAKPLGTVYVYRVIAPNGNSRMTIGLNAENKINLILFQPDR